MKLGFGRGQKAAIAAIASIATTSSFGSVPDQKTVSPQVPPHIGFIQDFKDPSSSFSRINPSTGEVEPVSKDWISNWFPGGLSIGKPQASTQTPQNAPAPGASFARWSAGDALPLGVPPLMMEPKDPERGTAMQPNTGIGVPDKPFVENADGATSERKADGTCFVRLPGQEQCFVDLQSIGSLGAKAAKILLLKNPAGLVAYSAYRFLATEDKKSEILADTLAGSSVSAAAVVSIAKHAKDALQPDTEITGSEALDALDVPSGFKALTLGGVAMVETGAALQSSSGPVAGIIDEAVSYGLSPLASTLGLKKEVINDPRIAINDKMVRAESMTPEGLSKVLYRQTPSFIEVGSFSLPNSNKVFQRDWSQEEMSLYGGRDLPKIDDKLALRDFVMEVHDKDGTKQYFTQTTLSAADGKPYFTEQGGPYATRDDARNMANFNAGKILNDPVFAMLSQGFVPKGPIGAKGFEHADTLESCMSLGSGQSLVRLAKREDGSLRYDELTQSGDNFKMTSRTYSGQGLQYDQAGQLQPESFSLMIKQNPKTQGSVVISARDAVDEFNAGVPKPAGLNASVSSPAPTL